MNYKKIYDLIIERSKIRIINEHTYYENHHILARCLGGSDDKENITKLTLREHFLAHKLLVEIYPDSKELKYAIWMMCITTLNAINEEIKKEKDKLNRILPRTFEKFKVSQRDYERYKQLYIDSKKGKRYSFQERKNVSDGTKKAMRDPERVLKRRKGVLGTKYYYDIKTKKSYKWFPGDPDIDLSKYAWGRGYKMSEEIKIKLSKMKELNRKNYWNTEIGIRVLCPKKMIKKLDWSSGRCDRKTYISLWSPTRLNDELLRDVHFELVKNGEFIDNILYIEVKEYASKFPRIWTFGFFEVCSYFIKKWIFNKNTIKNKDEFVQEFAKFIVDNKEEIKKKNIEIYKEFPNFNI